MQRVDFAEEQPVVLAQLFHLRTEVRPLLLRPRLAQHQLPGGLDNFLAERLDLNTAPTLFIGSYYQLLIRQEVVEQKYALSSSDPEDKIFSIAITRSRSCLEDGGDIWSHVWTSCMDFSVVVGV